MVGMRDNIHACLVDTNHDSLRPFLMHATAQGVIAGANMILVDFHPEPAKALVDGPQAMTLEELPWFLEDVQIARVAYEQRVAAAARLQTAA